MARVYFVSEVEKVKSKTISWGWYVIWGLSSILLILFYLHPDWFVLPPTWK